MKLVLVLNSGWTLSLDCHYLMLNPPIIATSFANSPLAQQFPTKSFPYRVRCNPHISPHAIVLSCIEWWLNCTHILLVQFTLISPLFICHFYGIVALSAWAPHQSAVYSWCCSSFSWQFICLARFYSISISRRMQMLMIAVWLVLLI